MPTLVHADELPDAIRSAIAKLTDFAVAIRDDGLKTTAVMEEIECLRQMLDSIENSQPGSWVKVGSPLFAITARENLSMPQEMLDVVENVRRAYAWCNHSNWCPHCGEPLRSPRARQCFACGANWH
jgi:hypothetical protein